MPLITPMNDHIKPKDTETKKGKERRTNKNVYETLADSDSDEEGADDEDDNVKHLTRFGSYKAFIELNGVRRVVGRISTTIAIQNLTKKEKQTRGLKFQRKRVSPS